MASQVEICNAALTKLGASRISDINLPDNKNARACLAVYERILFRELRKHVWSFAIKRVQLPALVDAPTHTMSYQYQLPSDFVRLAPQDPETMSLYMDWRIEGGTIVTNESAPIDVRYVYAVEDPNLMDSLFRDAFATAMALELCEELTQSNTKREALRQDYKEIYNEAKRANAIELVAPPSPEDPWVSARENGAYRANWLTWGS